MIIDFKKKLVFLSNPKAASTTIEALLMNQGVKGRIGGCPRLKHLNYNRYNDIAHVIGTMGFVTICLVRNPMDKFYSWYRYRSRNELKGMPRYLGDKSLQEHINTASEKDLSVCDDRNFILSGDRRVDIVFKYENFDECIAFFEQLYECTFEVPRLNVSGAKTAISRTHNRALAKKLVDAISWYKNLDGYTSDSAYEFYTNHILTLT